MKKIIKVLLLGLLLLFVGCGNKVKVPDDLVGKYNIDDTSKNDQGDITKTVMGGGTVSKKGNIYYVEATRTTNNYNYKLVDTSGPKYKWEYTPSEKPYVTSYKFSGEIIKVDNNEKIAEIYFDIKDIEASTLKDKLEMQRDPSIFLKRKVIPSGNFKNEKELLTVLSINGVNFKKIK